MPRPEPVSRRQPRLTADTVAAVWEHLTSRDKQLLTWLSEHQVFTTSQIATALYPTLLAAQKRLLWLTHLGALARFRGSRAAGDSREWRYTLGPVGDLLHPPPNGRRSSLQRRADVWRHPKLDHLLGVNGFFTTLYGHTRTHPGTALVRWWSETRATSEFSIGGIHPDGHGIWHAGDRSVGFFLEYDNGTEDHARLLAKLPAYQRLTARGGPTYPILFYLPGPGREHNLQRILTAANPTVMIATAVHGGHPAEAIWSLIGLPGVRLSLDELPSNHGTKGASNLKAYRDPPDSGTPYGAGA
jgi:Replication-relaxation